MRQAVAIHPSGAFDDAHGRQHAADIVRWSYERFSPAAIDSVQATAALAYADNAPAEPRHLRRALDSSPSADEWERYRATGPGAGSAYSVFTAELRAVLELSLELADGPVEPAHLAAALDS